MTLFHVFPHFNSPQPNLNLRKWIKNIQWNTHSRKILKHPHWISDNYKSVYMISSQLFIQKSGHYVFCDINRYAQILVITTPYAPKPVSVGKKPSQLNLTIWRCTGETSNRPLWIWQNQQPAGRLYHSVFCFRLYSSRTCSYGPGYVLSTLTWSHQATSLPCQQHISLLCLSCLSQHGQQPGSGTIRWDRKLDSDCPRHNVSGPNMDWVHGVERPAIIWDIEGSIHSSACCLQHLSHLVSLGYRIPLRCSQECCAGIPNIPLQPVPRKQKFPIYGVKEVVNIATEEPAVSIWR